MSFEAWHEPKQRRNTLLLCVCSWFHCQGTLFSQASLAAIVSSFSIMEEGMLSAEESFQIALANVCIRISLFAILKRNHFSLLRFSRTSVNRLITY